MTKVIDKKYLITGIILGLFLICIIFACTLAAKTKSENPDSWTIRSYENNIVLFNNGEIVEVFGDIALEDSPYEDQLHLEKGITFLTESEALTAMEDYDG